MFTCCQCYTIPSILPFACDGALPHQHPHLRPSLWLHHQSRDSTDTKGLFFSSRRAARVFRQKVMPHLKVRMNTEGRELGAGVGVKETVPLWYGPGEEKQFWSYCNLVVYSGRGYRTFWCLDAKKSREGSVAMSSGRLFHFDTVLAREKKKILSDGTTTGSCTAEEVIDRFDVWTRRCLERVLQHPLQGDCSILIRSLGKCFLTALGFSTWEDRKRWSWSGVDNSSNGWTWIGMLT